MTNVTSLSTHIPNTVLITGATGDFGKSFALRFGSLGSKLILHGRNPNKLEELVNYLSSEGEINPENIHSVCFDIKDFEAMKEQINGLPSAFEGIDLLINNAGLALGLEPAYEADIEDWNTMIDVNAKALVQMTHVVLPKMKQRDKGHIINIGSTAGSYPYPGGHVYCASKAFVKQFSLSLRADLLGCNIRVTNIEPGQVETQFSKVRFKGNEEKAKKVYEGMNNIKAHDIAEAVFWSATLPPSMNINRMEIMPTQQAFGPLAVNRKH